MVAPCDTAVIETEKYTKNRFFIEDYKRIRYGSCVEIIEQLGKGALTVAIASWGLEFYQDGTFSTNETELDHVVTLIGYHYQKKYLIRNTWGPSWGKDQLAYVDASTGVCRLAMYPIIKTTMNNKTSELPN